MKISRVIAIAVIAASGVVGYDSVEAQSLRDVSTPAEFPPASYTGRQYVDSNGCVFIRAGIDGNVTWVPRVSRSRQVVCGFQPSLPGARSAPEPTTTVASAPPAAKPAPGTTTTTTVRTKPATQPVARAPAAKPAPTVVPRRTAAPVLVAPAPAPVATAPAKTRRVVTQSQGGCVGRSELSMRYMRGNSVRCGPQAESPVTYAGNAAAPRRVAPAPVATQIPTYTAPSYDGSTSGYYGSGYVGSAQRVAPKHVYNRQVASQRGIQVPEGYKRVWMDGRLNPRRAHQTFDGKAQMELVWTKTVPRRLIIRETGRVVTQDYPGLMYPYTSYEQQARANVTPTISSRGTLAKAPATTTVSTRSAATTARSQPAKAASHSYVQAGVFTTRAQAQQAASRVTGAGLPARLGTLRRNGQTYSILLAGPFRSQSQLDAAFSAVRRAGFGNAKLRN